MDQLLTAVVVGLIALFLFVRASISDVACRQVRRQTRNIASVVRAAAHRGKYFLFMVRAGAATILSAIEGKAEVEKETA